MKRLVSLDLLRGFDLFLLVAFCPLLLRMPIEGEWFVAVKEQFTHCSWAGFRLWDLVMPLFMFCAGASIPFALSKFKSGELGKRELFVRILKRVAILWILGMVVQGNLLRFENIKIFSNTLQAIAVGYFLSALIFVYLKRVWWWIVGVSLLLIYWGIMEFVGGGDWGEVTNLAMNIDKSVMGVMCDGAELSESGSVVFAPWYYYAWLLPSLNFVVTVLIGVMAGDFLKNNEKWVGFGKFWVLLGSGLTILNLGWAWDTVLPVIKPIWTSSMVLVSGGWCLILLAGFYLVFDVWQVGVKWVGWLKIYGMNSIVAYVLSEAVNWHSVSASIFGGFAGLNERWAAFVLEFGCVAIVFFILWLLYKNRVFIKI